jgi:hypothetical protein
MLWPLLPPSWRTSVPATLRQLARGMGLPLLQLLLRRRCSQAKPAAPAP